MEIGSSLWMVLRVSLVNGATSHPWGWCRGLSLWMLPMTLVCMMLFSAFCVSVILVFSSNGDLFLSLFLHTWGKLIRIVISSEMGSVDSSEWPMKRKHHYVVWMLRSTWFKRVWFAPFCVAGWDSGSWGWWNTDFWVQKLFFNSFTLQISRFCIVPAEE